MCNQTLSCILQKESGDMSTPNPLLMHIIKKHVVGGAGLSIAELWGNHKTTTRGLPNDLGTGRTAIHWRNRLSTSSV